MRDISVDFYRKRGKRSKNAPPPSDSDTDDDLKKETVSSLKYRDLKLREALHRHEDYPRAVKELEHVVRLAYNQASKPLKATIFEDVKLAVELNTGLKIHILALKRLVEAVLKVFPKSKREFVRREHKKIIIKLQHSLKKDTIGASSGTSINDVPDNVLDNIFGFLDPYSLARSACVCRCWSTVASNELLWKKYLPKKHQIAAMTQHKSFAKHFTENLHIRNVFWSNRYVARKFEWRSGDIDIERINKEMQDDLHEASPRPDMVVDDLFGHLDVRSRPWECDSDNEGDESRRRLLRFWHVLQSA